MLDDLCKILDTGSAPQKITALQKLSSVSSARAIVKVIECLDDDNLQVRGEAFSVLLLNEGPDVSDHVINSLSSASKNIRAFASLVLANRGDSASIPHLVKLARDESSMVRSCAAGALGHLGANGSDAVDAMETLLFDDNADVQKSAAHSIITVGHQLPPDVLRKLSKKWGRAMQSDADLRMLFERLDGSVR